MKKIYIILLLLFVNVVTRAQISITQNDMPHPGDSARFTNAVLNLFINYAATGANHSWDFHDLRAASQGLQQYQTVSSTNIIYSVVYINFPFNPNRSTVASNTTEAPTNPLITLSNPYNFYYLNSSHYQETGFGADIAGVSVPVPYNNKDVIYNLPENFGNIDTSNSDWNINIPGTGDMGYAQTRINNADGWGTLITPRDTFTVIRVKTTRAQRDTFAVDTLGGFAVDRPLINEYKWLANGEIIPVMQITTQTIFGLEVVTNIFFRDDYIRVVTDPLNASIFCAGSSISVPYTKYGTFNGPALFSAGNVFTAQLSDSSGSFASPINIGSVTSTQSGNINAVIPPGTIPGNHYRIRIISSNLPVTGSDNGTDITIINNIPAVTGLTASGPLNFCAPGSVMLSVDSGTYYTYQWLNNGIPIAGAVSPDYTATTSGTYTIQIANACGMDSSAATVVSVDTLPIVTISNSGSSTPCQGDTLALTSTTINATSLQWQVNSVDIPGETGANLMITQNGNYTLVATDLCGNTTSGGLPIVFGLPPSIPLITSSSLTACAGDSILLESSDTTGVTLQWQLNGIDISGANDSILYTGTSGNYTISSTNGCGTSMSAISMVTINPLPAIPVITQSYDTLYSTTAGTYQWYLNGALIQGATLQYYIASQNGDYTVVIGDINGCNNSSVIYTYTSVGLQQVSSTGLNINVYPNPVSGTQMNITWNNNESVTMISVENMLGQIIYSYNISANQNKLTVDVKNLSSGMYNLKCFTLKGNFNYKFIKE